MHKSTILLFLCILYSRVCISNEYIELLSRIDNHTISAVESRRCRYLGVRKNTPKNNALYMRYLRFYGGDLKPSENILCQIEYLEYLIQKNKLKEARSIFDNIDMDSLSAIEHLLLIETIGNYHRQLNNYGEAIKSYSYALRIERDSESDDNEWWKYIRHRIKKRRLELNKLWDIDRYGSEWVLYRDAERDLLNHNFMNAYVNYQKIIAKYPQTIYAIASRAHIIDCLFNIDNQKEKRDAIKKMLLSKRLFNKDKDKNLEKINELDLKLQILQDMPVGKEAIQFAITSAKSILKDEYGLYNGDVIESVAEYYLHDADSDKANDWYHKLYDWCNECQQVKLNISVPERVSKVSAPPKQEHTSNGWNKYSSKVNIKPGQIVNRMTCDWYINSLSSRSSKILSFLYFVSGDTNMMFKYVDEALKYDAIERDLFNDNRPNFCIRLKNGYQRGWLRKPRNLSGFSRHQKYMILLSDFYYEIEDESRCESVLRRILNGEYGRLNRSQESIVNYRLSSILYRRIKINDSLDTLTKITKTGNSEVVGLAYIGIGNILVQSNNKKDQDKAVECYEKALKTGITKEDREKVMFFIARASYYFGHYDKSEQFLNSIIKKFPSGRMIMLSKQYLGKLKEK